MKRLAVIGNPVAHSRSPEIHNAFAQQAGLEIDYQRLLAPLDKFRKTALDFIGAGAVGFNVTVPFKFEAFNLCDVLSDAARQSEAVNTVTVRDGKPAGDNTDGVGLRRDIEANLGWQLAGRRILLLGAGGAVSGVLPALISVAPTSVHIYNRTYEKAQALEARYGGPVRALARESLEADYDVIISGTSAGLSGAAVDLPTRIVGGASRCYDMIYADAVTPFNAWAHAQGCEASSDGLGMLVEQAAEAFSLWFDFAPETRMVIENLRAQV